VLGGRRTFVYEFTNWVIDPERRELRAGGRVVPLDRRAFAVMERLLRSAGQAVGEDALMCCAWPDGGADASALQAQISAIRAALGSDHALLETVAGRGYRLHGVWHPVNQATYSFEGVHHKTMSGRPVATNIRPATSALVGRDADVRELGALVSRHRMVTATGPAGVGKSRLIRAVAQALFPSFDGDAWLVDFAPLSDARLVPSAISIALELGLPHNHSIIAGALSRTIEERRMLLLLDNCEQVADATAMATADILRWCPNVSIIASSRNRLGLEGERLYPVHPLDVAGAASPAADAPNVDKRLRCSAVQLFIARATGDAPGFAPQAEELAAITKVCRTLNGLPLAVELAAAHAAALGPSRVAADLDAQLDPVTQGWAELPTRATLDAALEWSQGLLTDSERRLLQRLAWFAGGFTVAGARAAMAEDCPTDPALQAMIVGLVSKSLLVPDDVDAAGRWHLHDAVRRFGGEKLRQSGDADLTARRHAAFFRDSIAAVTLGNGRPRESEYASLAHELDNVRTALDWSFSPTGDRAIGVVLTAAYVPIWLSLSLTGECGERAERALACVHADRAGGVSLSAKARCALALVGLGLELRLTDVKVVTEAIANAERLLAIDRAIGVRWKLWQRQADRGDWQAALAVAERCVAEARRLARPVELFIACRLRGTAYHFTGDQSYASEMEDVEKRLRDVPGGFAPQQVLLRVWHDQQAMMWAMLARIHCLTCDFGGLPMEIERLLQSVPHHTPVTACYLLGWSVVPVLLMIGNHEGAESALAMLEHRAEAAGPYWKLRAKGLRGMMQFERGDWTSAVDLLGELSTTLVRERRHTGFPEMIGCLAQGLGKLGRFKEALITIDNALSRAERGKELWCKPHLLKIKGDLLASTGDTRAARKIFMNIQRGVGGHADELWRLEAVNALARLFIVEGQPEAARSVLEDELQRHNLEDPVPLARDAQNLLRMLSSPDVSSERQ
jgi:predicted ATPase/DNA-binding winged helix-turn-helix (wHTH) protein